MRVGQPSASAGNWLPWAAGSVSGTYAAAAWVAVEPNQDLLADGIQVQQILSSPTLVLSFPGQKHGGTIEYLYGLAAEWLFPGSYLAHSLIRVFFAFMTAWLAAKLFRVLFRDAPNWTFLAAVIAGPTILQGMAGPPSNPVGVYWMTPTYDLSWLLVLLGAWLWARELSQSRRHSTRPLVLIGAGVAIGLGVYQQPTIALLVAPIVFLVLALSPVNWRATRFVTFGVAVGLIPAVVNFFTYSGVVTWNPSHFPVFQPKLALGVLGLDGIPSYFFSVLPYSLGLAPSENPGIGLAQSAVMWIVVIWIFSCAVWAGWRALKDRQRLSSGGALALAWVIAIAGLEIFTLVVDPIWFYGASLGILLWLSLGAMTTCIGGVRGRVILTFFLATIGISTLVHNAYWWLHLPAHSEAKWTHEQQLREMGHRLTTLGVEFAYGSYYDAIPIAYGSGGDIRPVTSTYNRFPVSKETLGEASQARIAINGKPRDTWGQESLGRVNRECDEVSWVSTEHSVFSLIGIFECPINLVIDPGNKK